MTNRLSLDKEVKIRGVVVPGEMDILLIYYSKQSVQHWHVKFSAIIIWMLNKCAYIMHSTTGKERFQVE